MLDGKIDQSDARAAQFVAQTANMTDNTAQEMIIVTRDKAELALHRNFPRYVPGGKMLASIGLLASLVITLVTANFRDGLGLQGATWQSFVHLTAILTAVVCAVDVVR